MTKNVLVPISDGCEELEAVTIINVLRRAGASVTVVSVAPSDGLQICASRGVNILADCAIADCVSGAKTNALGSYCSAGRITGLRALGGQSRAR